MLDVLVGIDVGTTSIKVVVTDFSLNILDSSSSSTPWTHKNNHSDIDMNFLAMTVIGVADRELKKIDAKARAIGITGFSETGALLGGDGEPLCNGFAWHDPRANLIQLEKEIGSDIFEKTVAAKITAVPSIGKILWQQEHYAATVSPKHFIGTPEWIMKCLGADIVNELSIVSRSGFLDILNKSPWNQGIELVKGGKDFLGRIVGAGEIIGIANTSAPKSLQGAVLTIAGHDHQTAAFYSGATRDGFLFDSMGTAEAIVRTYKGVISQDAMSRLAKAGVNVGWTVIPDHQMLLAGLPTGISLERLGSLLGYNSVTQRNELGKLALSASRDNSDINVIGSYGQLDITGITDGATPALVWRVAVEDLTKLYEERLSAVEREIGKHQKTIIGGGWIHNPMVEAVKRLEYGKFEISDVQEPGAMGAAEFAGIALGVIKARWL
jgi:sugar (pentulose or hexulose) kinase